ncbi:hypothetical protein FANTH_3866 [Fusarium anthophilum]|uniref:Ubiquinol-cytochrome-c reductase cytochrome c1 n=1 Tax=Fusarium anthophilum TaxID=48485 RepID=A0A8H5E8T0_9HYPO|nr:hypothetical protein FANTH_3866 [Fusarium anthophilum]
MGPVVGTKLDERVIYQATKHVFVGKYAKIRQLAVVRGSISNNLLEGNPVKQVVADHGFDAVAEVVSKLLLEKVYESEAIANQRFSDLEPSSVQTAASTQVKAEATTTEKVTLEGVELANSNNSRENGHTEEEIKPVQDASDSTASDIGGIPVYLPFPAEHLLMEKLQKVLEAACYEYGGKKKLNKKSLQSIAQIRHTAVHRLRTDSTGLQRFLADAENLARALGDDLCTRAISKLRLDAETAITELTQHKKSLRLQLDEAQEEIAKRRAELDQQEQENLGYMETEDKRYSALAGEKLQRALNIIENFAVMSETGGAALNGDRDPLSDDSSLDHAEHFEDCRES